MHLCGNRKELQRAMDLNSCINMHKNDQACTVCLLLPNLLLVRREGQGEGEAGQWCDQKKSNVESGTASTLRSQLEGRHNMHVLFAKATPAKHFAQMGWEALLKQKWLLPVPLTMPCNSPTVL